LPEAQQCPGLTGLLQAANSRGSQLMTLGCAGALEQRKDAPRQGEPTWCASAYVAVTFRDPAHNSDPQFLVRLAKHILNGCSVAAGHFVNFNLHVTPLKLFFGREGRYELLLRPAEPLLLLPSAIVT